MVTTLVSNPNDFVPQGLDPAINNELASIWKQVQERVLQLAGGDSRNVKSLTVGGVLTQLDQAQKSDKKAGPKTQVIRNTFDRTLSLIQTVGGIAAGAASQVFGPSELCFNALSFVIDAWKGYERIFEELSGLLEKCIQYLGRMEYHVKGGMDANLSRVACQHLLLFVEICGRTVNLRPKHRKFMTFAKMFFFQDDSGVNDLIQKMADLGDNEGQLVAAQTFALASDAAKTSKSNLDLTQKLVDTIAEDNASRKKEKDEQYLKQVILKVLAFDEDKMDSTKSGPEAIWKTIYRNYLGQRLTNSGEWIFNEPKYAAWEAGQSRVPILAIEGGEGSGKSYLASTIINHLKKQKAERKSSDTRLSTAYYFLEGSSKEELKKSTNLETVSKSLVWQFSETERLYTKSAAHICKALGEIDPAYISQHLIFGNRDLANMDVTFYIVIDGLGDAAGEGMIQFLRRASTLMPGRDVRVLLTGHPSCFQQLAKDDCISYDLIQISSHNKPDVVKYIKWRMDRIPALSDRTRVGIPELRARICDKLHYQTDGDYIKIDTALNHISTLEYETEIEQALKEASKERSQQITEEIDTLSKVRSEKEITEINEIILWILYCRNLPTPKQMSAALYVKSGESSLLPIRRKFSLKYPLFHVNNNGKVDFRSSKIGDHIHTRQRGDGGEGQSDVKVKPAETAMVTHFLHTVCPDDVYAKFNFDKFLAQQSETKGGLIYKDDPDTGETKMALACLNVLTQEVDERRSRLLPYARSNLFKHLSSVDLALADIVCKSEVGKCLAKLFKDGASIDTLLQNDESVKIDDTRIRVRRDWLCSDDWKETILRWLGDSAVISEIHDKLTHDWITSLVSRKNQWDLLRPATERMAMQFVQEPHFKQFTKDVFLFIYGYIGKTENPQSGAEQEAVDASFIPSVEQVEEVERWCEATLNVKTKNSLWHTQMSILLAYYKYNAQAEARARQALALDSTNWRASHLLADAVAPEKGIEILKPIAQRLESNDEWKNGIVYKMGLAKMLHSLGRFYWETKQSELGVPVQTRALKVDFTDYPLIRNLLLLYGQEKQWSHVISAMGTIQEVSTEQLQGLPELLITFFNWGKLHEVVCRATLETEKFGFLEEIYERAIQLLKERDQRKELCFIRYFYGEGLYAHPQGQLKAIAQWEQALDEDVFHASSAVTALFIAKLGPLYLHNALASGPDTEATSSYLHKIEAMLPEGVHESDVLLPPKSYLARYYHVRGDTARAKQIIRDTVKLAIEILSDDDEANDYFAYSMFMAIFVSLEDHKNFTTLRELFGRLGGYGSVFQCQGDDCDFSWGILDAMWWCRDCLDVNFDEKCYRQDNMRFTTCNKSHNLFYLAKMELEKDVPEGCVLREGEIISMEEWLKEIKKSYMDTQDK